MYRSDGNMSSRITDQIGVTCSKLRSCSLGQSGLQTKPFNCLVTNSVNIVKGISSSGTEEPLTFSLFPFWFITEEVNRALSLSQICSFGTGNKESNENTEAKDWRKMFLIRQTSNSHSLISSGSDSLDSISLIQGPRMGRRRAKEVGRLNPDLYRRMSNSSTSNTSGFGDINISYAWIGQKYDQLKIRILKVKNIPVEYYRTGLYLRLKN